MCETMKTSSLQVFFIFSERTNDEQIVQYSLKISKKFMVNDEKMEQMQPGAKKSTTSPELEFFNEFIYAMQSLEV